MPKKYSIFAMNLGNVM